MNAFDRILEQIPAGDIIKDLNVLDNVLDSGNQLVKNIENKIKIASKNARIGIFNLFGGN